MLLLACYRYVLSFLRWCFGSACRRDFKQSSIIVCIRTLLTSSGYLFRHFTACLFDLVVVVVVDVFYFYFFLFWFVGAFLLNFIRVLRMDYFILETFKNKRGADDYNQFKNHEICNCVHTFNCGLSHID